MKRILIGVMLLAFAGVCVAAPKDDLVTAIATCAAANPDPTSADRQACDRAAIAAFLASRSGQTALSQAKAKAKK